MWVRSIWLFRHLKYQNLSTGDDFIQSSRIIFLFHFWPPRRHWHHLQMILSYRGDRYRCLDTLNVKKHPLFQILKAFLDGCERNIKICQELMGIYTTLKVQTSYVLYKSYHCPLILSEHTGKDNQLFKIDYIDQQKVCRLRSLETFWE